MKNLTLFLFLLCAVLLSSCTPEDDTVFLLPCEEENFCSYSVKNELGERFLIEINGKDEAILNDGEGFARSKQEPGTYYVKAYEMDYVLSQDIFEYTFTIEQCESKNYTLD